MMLPTGKNEAFTLIEALVTVVILAVGITLVLRAFETSLYALSESRHSMRAYMLIGKEMSNARLASANESDPNYDVKIEQADRTPASAAMCSNRLNKVTVTVQRKGSDRKYSATTYITTRSSS